MGEMQIITDLQTDTKTSPQNPRFFTLGGPQSPQFLPVEVTTREENLGVTYNFLAHSLHPADSYERK